MNARLAPGSTLGRFAILGLVGRGGMGEVYVALEPTAGGSRRVALKVLGTAALTAEGAQRFDRERELLARVSHAGVVRALGPLETASGLAHFPMELVLGKSLADLVAEHGRFAIVEAVRVLGEVAAALGATHQAGIVHRDVKPSNIIIARDGAVRLTDFGLARVVDSSRFTATGSALGTPAYMAPEQAAAREVGPPADRYALGAVAYELLVGHPPFQAENPLALLRLHIEGKPVPPRELRPEIPASLERLVLALLEKDPAARPEPRAAFAAITEELTLGNAAFVANMNASIARDTVRLAALAAPEAAEPPSPSGLAGLLPAAVALVVLVGFGVYVLKPHAPASHPALVTLGDGKTLEGEIARIESDHVLVVGSDGVTHIVSRSQLRAIDYR